MTYRMGGRDCSESGHDLFVLTREGEAWRAVWRALLPAGETKGGG